MKRKKLSLRAFLLFSSFWLFFSFVITFVFFPYETVNSNKYFSYKFYNIILKYFQETFNHYVFIVFIFLVLFYIVRNIFLKIKKIKYKNSDSKPKRLLRNIFFRTIIIAIALCLVVINLSIYLNQNGKGPNILLIIVDTLRVDHTAIGKYKKNITPYLKDLLMKDGISFTNAFSNSPWTLPSVASLITSQYPSKINITSLLSKLNDESITLAELLKENGYSTCGIVSAILLKEIYGVAQGFDIYNDRNISEEFANFYSISSPGITEDALKFIKKNKKKKFFLFLHYYDPHYIYIDHEKAMPYTGDFRSRDMSKLRALIRKKKYEKKDIDYLRYSYDTEIKFTDRYIRKVIEELKFNNIYDNTLIIFTADHGEEFVEKGWLGHSTTVYNEQIKIPTVIKLPHHRNKSGIKIKNSLISNIDILPTITALLKIKNPQKSQGKNVFLKNTTNPIVFSEVQQDQFGELIDKACIIRGEWKLIKDFIKNRYQLYNLKLDPGEHNDRSSTEKDICSALKIKLAKWIRLNRHQRIKKERSPLTDKEKKRLKTLGYLN